MGTCCNSGRRKRCRKGRSRIDARTCSCRRSQRAGVGWRMSNELANARNRRSRQRRKEGLRSWDLDLPDVATEDMIDALIYYGRLSESEAENEDRVAVELSVL